MDQNGPERTMATILYHLYPSMLIHFGLFQSILVHSGPFCPFKNAPCHKIPDLLNEVNRGLTSFLVKSR
jgi:hypothetical protein